MYQFQISSQADIIMPLDLSAVFFVLIEQNIIDQKGLFQGVVPVQALRQGLEHISTHLAALPRYHEFLITDMGREYAKIRPSYFNNDKLQNMIPDDLKPFLQKVDGYNEILRRDFSSFYKLSSPETLLISAELKKRLFVIMDMMKRADSDTESIMFNKL